MAARCGVCVAAARRAGAPFSACSCGFDEARRIVADVMIDGGGAKEHLQALCRRERITLTHAVMLYGDPRKVMPRG